MKKKITFATIVLAALSIGLILNLGNSASAAPTKTSVKLDGKNIAFPDTQPYVNEDNRTMVPIRFISEAMGCDVVWEDTNQIVTINKGDKRILLRIGENWAIVNDSKADVRKEFDTKAILKNDRTMVPLRFVSETLGVGVAWDNANNTAILRSDGTIEAIATPPPAVTPSPTTTPKFHDIIIDYSNKNKDDDKIPVPTGTPSHLNSIPGNPYYICGLTGKEDLKRFVRLQPLFKYDDIVAISGDYNYKDLGRIGISYGCWNPYQKRYDGYLSVDARESGKSFDISISKGGEKEIQRLREVINIAVIGDQEYKDFVFNTIMSCKKGFKGGTIQYTDGSYLTIIYRTGDDYKDIWGDEAFFVTAWR